MGHSSFEVTFESQYSYKFTIVFIVFLLNFCSTERVKELQKVSWNCLSIKIQVRLQKFHDLIMNEGDEGVELLGGQKYPDSKGI